MESIIDIKILLLAISLTIFYNYILSDDNIVLK